MNAEELRQHMQSLFEECLEISKKKNHDYTQGGKNALKNFELVEYLDVTTTPEGLFVRILDKISRLATLLKREGQVQDEKIEDTIRDCINYLAILDASLKKTGEPPKEPPRNTLHTVRQEPVLSRNFEVCPNCYESRENGEVHEKAAVYEKGRCPLHTEQ